LSSGPLFEKGIATVGVQRLAEMARQIPMMLPRHQGLYHLLPNPLEVPMAREQHKLATILAADVVG
jgi:hypothetical protein